MSELFKQQKTLEQFGEFERTLLSSLNEEKFFTQLGQFLMNQIAVDRVLLYEVLEDSSSQLVVDNGVYLKDSKRLKKNGGVIGHVLRTKKPYFSNHPNKDPLFQKSTQEHGDGIKAELCIPVGHEGILLATAHFQILKGNEQQANRHFEQCDIAHIQSILDKLSSPLKNMKLYLSAKKLNEVLLKKIGLKEKENVAHDLYQGGGRSNGSEFINFFPKKQAGYNKKLIGESSAIKKINSLCEKMANSDDSVLIQGETGIGKELMAQKIHFLSKRKNAPLASLDCSSLEDEQLQKELFGEGQDTDSHHEKFYLKTGLLEAAHQGTLILKNISALSLNVQAQLARFIKTQRALRVGGRLFYQSNIRIVATTTEDLSEEVKKQSFRKDLFYYLSTLLIEVPPLRDRPEDIPLLAKHFLFEQEEKSNLPLDGKNKARTSKKSFSKKALESLIKYSWPGNVTELKSMAKRAYFLSDGMIIKKKCLSEQILMAERKRSLNIANQLNQLNQQNNWELISLALVEKKHICQTLNNLRGNKTRTAKILGITVKTLYNKLHNYGIFSRRS